MGHVAQETGIDNYTRKLVRGVKNNNPDAINYLFSNSEPIFINFATGVKTMTAVNPYKRLYSDYLEPWAAKLGYALWYESTGRILDENAVISVQIQSNYDLMTGSGNNEIFESMGAPTELK